MRHLLFPRRLEVLLMGLLALDLKGQPQASLLLAVLFLAGLANHRPRCCRVCQFTCFLRTSSLRFLENWVRRAFQANFKSTESLCLLLTDRVQ